MNAGRNHNLFVVCTIALLLPAASWSADAGSIRPEIEQGNELFSAGEYTAAIDAYDRALITEPQAVEPRFNKANCYYRLDDLEQAMELYRETAAESKDMSLVAKAKYNLGNCYFQRGSKQADSDLNKALEDMQTSIKFWRQVLELEPENKKAARNIEVARLTIKDIIDRINKQQQQQQKQAEKQKQLIERLKELLAEQKTLAGDTEKTNELSEKNLIDEAKTHEQYAQQKDRQDSIKQRTEQVTMELQQQDPNTPRPPKMDEAARELAQAVGNQVGASEKLAAGKGPGAWQSEQKAAQYIENAIDILSQEDRKQQQNQQQQQDQQSQDQNKPQQQQQQDPNQPADPNEQQQQQKEQQERQKQQQQSVTAQEILDKEQERKKQRQMLQMPQSSRVEKDW